MPKRNEPKKRAPPNKGALLSPFAQVRLNFIKENASIKAPTAHHHAFGGHPRAKLLKMNQSLLTTIFL
ncbi:MAG: hypothetical protein AAF564_00740, partial [Bacteroidota bacterium]